MKLFYVLCVLYVGFLASCGLLSGMLASSGVPQAATPAAQQQAAKIDHDIFDWLGLVFFGVGAGTGAGATHHYHKRKAKKAAAKVG